MKYQTLIRDIRAALPALALREGEALSGHCSFRIGGPAAVMALPQSGEELSALCRLLGQKGVSPLILGNGTNILFPDGGYDGVVIKTAGCGGVTASEGRVCAQCGASLAQTAAAAAAAGLTGLEFAHGIPGSVGGGAVMNAGAYGGELKDVLAETEYIGRDMETHTLRGEEQGLSYRKSFVADEGGVVTRCVFALAPGEEEAIARRMRELGEKRRENQPLELPSAGSFFKRPAEGFAAAYIEQAGLKGLSAGGARVSEKHAGFIVNTGGATQADVLTLMERVQEAVLRRFGVTLEPEVRIIRG